MKKVLVLAAAIALFATPALSAITGTKHDLSAYGGAGNELCVFCHTPHGGATGGIAPLWNRSQVSATNFYNSATLDAATSVASANLTDAPLCLSCHDGSVAEVLTNEPNAGATDATGLVVGANATLGTDLSNDHPIGFDYTTVALADGGSDAEINSKAAAEGVLGTGALSFGGGNDMWCSSCHDVHGVAGVSTFLRVANTNSNLCKACHGK